MSGAATAVITELLSPFHLLRRGGLAAAWLLVAAAVGAWVYRHRPALPRVTVRPLEASIAAVILAIAAVVGYTAILSPPNSADAMAYHMPRVLYWAQAGSVAFFPTPYYNQITLQPLAEYFMLHTYVLSGGDHLINLVAFFGFLGSIVGVSAIAGALGLGSKGQSFAALFCATLPNGILQASGAKNDFVLAAWLVAMVYFAARKDAPYTGLALGLALATKATAYLFAPPMLAAVWLCSRPQRREAVRMLAFLAGGVLLINAPQYLRNVSLSGSPLGYDSAQGDGVYRWRNEHPGWKSTVSNLLRNTSEQLGARSPRWNQTVFDTVVKIHRALGIDPHDPDTTWPYTRYEPPRTAKNHEADANNRWHLLLLAVAAIFAAATRRRTWMLYAAGLIAAFLIFCFYLKWQLYLPRLELPLFVLGAPLAAALMEAIRAPILAIVLCAFLVNNTRASLFENWTRPLHGPRNLFITTRDANYFADMVQWNNRASYLPAIELTARSGCETVGIDIGLNQLEYPFQALLRERNPRVRYVHTGVENTSARYYPAVQPQPCAVFCPDCAGIEKKVTMYAGIGPPIVLDHFLLFLGPSRRQRDRWSREVDSFGTIAQRLGAKGVIASLWSVSDEAAARLMETMYRIRQSKPELGSEALRQAQAQMAAGLLEPDDAAAADCGVQVKPAASAAIAWTHPYYWAPFILIGNWK